MPMIGFFVAKMSPRSWIRSASRRAFHGGVMRAGLLRWSRREQRERVSDAMNFEEGAHLGERRKRLGRARSGGGERAERVAEAGRRGRRRVAREGEEKPGDVSVPRAGRVA